MSYLEAFLKDSEGYPTFLIDKKLDKYYVDFKVYEVVSWDGETHEPEDKKLYVSGTIKWDGCSHIWFNPYLHLCGKHYWDLHCKVMNALWEMAAAEVEAFDEEVAQ